MKISDIKGLYHVILITFRPDTPQEVREEVYEFGQRLGQIEELGEDILHWTLQNNRDLRKNVHLVEFAVFKDEAAFQRFKDHPQHQEFLAKLKEVADWQVGDFVH